MQFAFVRHAIAASLLVFASGQTFSQPAAVDDQTAIQIEALNRLRGLDLESNAALKGAVLKVLEKTRGTPHFVELVREFNLKGHGPALLDYALQFPNETSGVEAFRLAAAELGRPAVKPLLSTERATAAVQLIGNSNDKELQGLLRAAVTDSGTDLPVRRQSVKALARSQDGARFLLSLAENGDLPQDVKLTASSELNLASWPEIKRAAGDLLPLPQTQNSESLPPIAELTQRTGDPKRGAEIYFSESAACSSCHQVNGQGMDFGPRLSEIGTKLGKEALYESILDPSGGISFGYEVWSIELSNGDEAFGLIASETADELAIRTQNGVVTKYKKTDIARRQKMSTSIMPTGLQLTMSTQDLVDLIEYLAGLKKAESPRELP